MLRQGLRNALQEKRRKEEVTALFASYKSPFVYLTICGRPRIPSRAGLSSIVRKIKTTRCSLPSEDINGHSNPKENSLQDSALAANHTFARGTKFFHGQKYEGIRLGLGWLSPIETPFLCVEREREVSDRLSICHPNKAGWYLFLHCAYLVTDACIV